MIASTTQDHTLNGCAVFRYGDSLIHFSHSLSLLKEGGFDLVVLGSSGHSNKGVVDVSGNNGGKGESTRSV